MDDLTVIKDMMDLRALAEVLRDFSGHHHKYTPVQMYNLVANLDEAKAYIMVMAARRTKQVEHERRIHG